MSLFLLWTLGQWTLRIVMVPVILRRRFLPATAVAWLAMIFLMPEIGLVFYLLIGSNRLGRRRVRRHRQVVDARRTEDRAPDLAAHAGRPDIGSVYNRVVIQAQRISGMPILGGNSVELLSDYDQAIDRLIADIDAAQHHVHLLYYIFAPDATGRRVAEALARAATRGVKCRVLADAAASRFLFRYSGLAVRLNEQGVETYAALPVARFRRKLARIDLRNHRKLAVIDSRIAYAGSQNIVDADYGYRHCPPSVDLTGRFAGPVVAQLQSVFLEDWEFETDQELTGDDLLTAQAPVGAAYAQAVATGPGPETEALPYLILAALNAAEQRIIITTPYFVPDEPTLFALTLAAERGVDVTIILPQRSDHALVSAAGRAYFETLLEAGVHIHLHQRGMLHAKTATIDDAIGLLGSSNLDIRSFYLNFELNVLLYGPQATQQLRAVQLSYLKDSIGINLDEWRRRPRFQQYLDSAAALLSPLL